MLKIILWGIGVLFIIFILTVIYCCLVLAHQCSEEEEKNGKG